MAQWPTERLPSAAADRRVAERTPDPRDCPPSDVETHRARRPVFRAAESTGLAVLQAAAAGIDTAERSPEEAALALLCKRQRELLETFREIAPDNLPRWLPDPLARLEEHLARGEWLAYTDLASRTTLALRLAAVPEPMRTAFAATLPSAPRCGGAGLDGERATPVWDGRGEPPAWPGYEQRQRELLDSRGGWDKFVEEVASVMRHQPRLAGRARHRGPRCRERRSRVSGRRSGGRVSSRSSRAGPGDRGDPHQGGGDEPPGEPQHDDLAGFTSAEHHARTARRDAAWARLEADRGAVDA
jgi:hypothetical protein